MLSYTAPQPAKQTKLASFFATKTLVYKAVRDAAAANQTPGEARPQAEFEAEVGITGQFQLPSEKDAAIRAREEAAASKYSCSNCKFACTTAVGLRNHSLSCTRRQTNQRIDRRIFRPFHGQITAPVRVTEDGAVKLYLLINGKDGDTLADEARERQSAWEAAAQERRHELQRRSDKAMQERARREAEADADEPLPEPRRGSDRRRQYSAKEKLQILKFHDSVIGDKAVHKKKEFFEADPRSRGARWCNVHWKAGNKTEGWAAPSPRRKIEMAAGQEHASTLLRIDSRSRKHGKFAGMERTLYGKFKVRRARGRKCDKKWFKHTARHIMRTDYPEHAHLFNGGECWFRRMCSRFCLTRRKKTNVKNTTWEETKPVLQRYFRSFRRRCVAEISRRHTFQCCSTRHPHPTPPFLPSQVAQ